MQVAYNSGNITGFYRSGGDFQIKNDNGAGTPESSIKLDEDGAVTLYHDNSSKLATTATGIDVTGTVTADGLTVDTDTLYVDATNDRVGIGTTSPSSALEVADSGVELKITDTRSQSFTVGDKIASLGFYSNDTSGGSGGANTLPRGAIDVITGNTFGSAHDMVFRTRGDVSTDASERLRITSAGKVGIGTTSPSQTLDVAGNIQATGASSIAALYDSNHYMRVEANASGGVLKGTDGGVVTTFVRSYGDSYFNGGNIGIGTTSPNSTLHVKSSGTNSQSLLRLESNSGTRAFIGSDAQDDSYLYLYDSSDTLKTAFRTDGNHSYIAGGGNFGIGTTSPSESLHVSGVARADTLRAGGGSNSAPGIAFINSTTTGLTNPAIATLGFVTGGQERIRINSSGNVAIGTSTPYEKLHVNGRVRASSVRCTSNGSYFHYAGFMGVPGIEIRHALSSSSTSLQTMIEFEHVSGGAVGSIKSNGTSTQYNTSSDERMKENIQDAGDAGAKIDAIQIRQFDWKDSNHHEDFGVIAQELQPVAPEAVSEGYTEEDMWSVDYSKLVPTLIKEIQSLRNRVAELEKK